MQAPLSSTASGQHFRTGPSSGLPPSSEVTGCALDPSAQREWRGSRVRAGAVAVSVAEGSGLAHDAGNLLGALRLYCDLLAVPGVLREEHRHYAEELQLLSRRSGVLIDRLLNPMATRRGQSVQEQVIVPEVVEQCRGLLSRIAHRAVDVTYGAGTLIPVQVPRESVERILVNLTKNAAEASRHSGAIRLRVCRVQDEVATRMGRSVKSQTRIALSVEDQGCGMSVAAVKVLLGVATEEPPQPADGHHGLGLRVIRELVRSSGGELRLKSRSGCGTTVEIAWAVADESSAPVLDERAVSSVGSGTGTPDETNTRAGKKDGLNGNGIEGGVSC